MHPPILSKMRVEFAQPVGSYKNNFQFFRSVAGWYRDCVPSNKVLFSLLRKTKADLKYTATANNGYRRTFLDWFNENVENYQNAIDSR